MPDRRKHRGRHPEDDRLFAAEARDGLTQATRDLSWLLGRDYTSRAALKLVGDRDRCWFNLTHDLLAAFRPSQDVVWLC